MKKLLISLFVASASPLLAANQNPAAAQAAVAAREMALLRVNVTGQAYDYFRPWQKRAPFNKRALGAVLAKGRILVTADLVSNQSYVELERADNGEKMAANVEVVDYEANLALLRPQEQKFVEGLPSFELAGDSVVGDHMTALQLEPTGALVVTDGLLTGVQMTRYPVDLDPLLTYRVSIPLQYRDNSYTVPLVKNNKLAGLLLRYDPRSQLMDVIPAPIIAHFLKDADSGNYRGFPSVGFDYFPTRDPQLRKYASETGNNNGGVYVTGVEPGSAGQNAGLQVGDVITSVGNFPLDQNGNYLDPVYRKLEFTNIITLRSFVGDRVPVNIERQGHSQQLTFTMVHRAPADYVVPPYERDAAPKFFVLGGLVFQELSREYLREWGNNRGDWSREAPQRFVYLDRYQWELFPEGNRHVVVLSQVLPTNNTLGYDELGALTIKKINGRDIHSLADVAAVAKDPGSPFYRIEAEEDHKVIVLDVEQTRADEKGLRENFGITELQR